ncbi:hypothetical protein CO613_11335 [Lysobacteraceae bacterium NML07-0707]|nr:hypothetical protein CO613_11335 [Xanthomonadaceae bacterium NML07-0707]
MAHDLTARLAIFAELMLGDTVLADTVAARALLAGQQTSGLSPLRAWRAMLEMPGLRAGKMPVMGQALQPLQSLTPGMRLLFLLATLSGGNAIELAALLKISPKACTQALQALQRQLSGRERETCCTALEMRQCGFSPARRTRIEQHMSGERPLQPPAKAPSRRWGLLLAVTLATGLALAATWFWPPESEAEDLISEIPPRIQTKPLAERAPARYDVETARVLVDREFSEISVQDAPIAAETAFFAWYQAERLGQAGGRPLALPEEAPVELPPESSDWQEEPLPEPMDD